MSKEHNSTEKKQKKKKTVKPWVKDLSGLLNREDT